MPDTETPKVDEALLAEVAASEPDGARPDPLPEEAAGETAQPEPTREIPEKRLPVFLPLVLGGVVAAAAGFAAGQYAPRLWTGGQDETAALQEQVAQLAADIATLKSTPADTGLADRVAKLESAGGDAAAQQIAALDQRIAKLEQAPPPVAAGADPEELQAIRDQITALSKGMSPEMANATEAVRKELAEAKSAAATLRAEAEAAAQSTARQAALDRLAAALDSGAPYAASLPALDEVPEVLATYAQSGLPTIAALRAGFDPAARTALDAALRAQRSASWADRVTTFFRTQTGARSLTPRDGNDPDAILSRADAALAEGRVTDAVAEVKSLPAEGQAPFADWIAAAETRIAAEAALRSLSAAKN